MSSQVIQYHLQDPQSRQAFIVMKAPASVVLAAPTHSNVSKTYVVSKNGFPKNEYFQKTEDQFFPQDSFDDIILDFVESTIEDPFPMSNNYINSYPQMSPDLINEDFLPIDDKFIDDLLQPDCDLTYECDLDVMELEPTFPVKESPDCLSYSSSISSSPHEFHFDSAENSASPPSSLDEVSYIDNYQCESSSFLESEFGDSEDIADMYLPPQWEENMTQSLEDDLMFSLDEDFDDNNSQLGGSTKRKSVYSPEQRRERKKASNRCAAYRYRQKQKAKVSDSEFDLREKITGLRKVQSSVNESRQTLDMLKKLAREVIEARKNKPN